MKDNSFQRPKLHNKHILQDRSCTISFPVRNRIKSPYLIAAVCLAGIERNRSNLSIESLSLPYHSQLFSPVYGSCSRFSVSGIDSKIHEAGLGTSCLPSFLLPMLGWLSKMTTGTNHPILVYGQPPRTPVRGLRGCSTQDTNTSYLQGLTLAAPNPISTVVRILLQEMTSHDTAAVSCTAHGLGCSLRPTQSFSDC